MLEICGWWGRCGVVVGCCGDGDAARRWEVDLVTRLRYVHVEPQRVTVSDWLPRKGSGQMQQGEMTAGCSLQCEGRYL